MSGEQHEGRPPRTANATGTATKDHSTAVTDNRADRCLDCDSERLVRGYHRCTKCLIALRDGLHRRHAADLRISRWHR